MFSPIPSGVSVRTKRFGLIRVHGVVRTDENGETYRLITRACVRLIARVLEVRVRGTLKVRLPAY